MPTFKKDTDGFMKGASGFKMKYSPDKKTGAGFPYKDSPMNNDESFWTRTKRQFSRENKYGFGDARGRDKSASTAQIKHQQKNPRKRGESYKDYNTRIGKPPSRKVANQGGLPGTGESSQK